MRRLKPRSVKHRRGALLLPGQPHTNMRVSDHPQVFDHGGLRCLWYAPNTFSGSVQAKI